MAALYHEGWSVEVEEATVFVHPHFDHARRVQPVVVPLLV